MRAYYHNNGELVSGCEVLQIALQKGGYGLRAYGGFEFIRRSSKIFMRVYVRIDMSHSISTYCIHLLILL